jgi:hypothetical protein
MGPESYRSFVEELVARLEPDPRVLGLVATGSMAARDILPDIYSDHDFWLVASPESAQSWRADQGFLPRACEIVFAFRETAHGVKVIYRDGHLVEYAVFAPAELGLARVNRYRVLIDRGGLAARLAALRSATLAESVAADETRLAGELLTQLLVGANRFRRGEVLSAHRLVAAGALPHLLALLARHTRTESPELQDDLDPARRFEETHPRLAARIAASLRRSPLETARELLEIYREMLAPSLPSPPAELVEIVSGVLGGVPADSAPIGASGT